MIKVADLPAVRAQLERAAAAANEKLAPEGDAKAAPTQPAPRRTMTLAAGKYYVTEDSK